MGQPLLLFNQPPDGGLSLWVAGRPQDNTGKTGVIGLTD